MTRFWSTLSYEEIDQIGQKLLFKEPNNSVTFFIHIYYFKWTFSSNIFKFFDESDCLSENVSFSVLSDHQKLANACAKKYYYLQKNATIIWLLVLSERQIDIFCNKQSRSITTFDNFLTESSIEMTWLKMTFIKNITWLLYYLNYQNGNFSPIWSNEVLISSQDNVLSENQHFFLSSLIRF